MAAVEVNHKSGAQYNETWDQFIERMFCGVTRVWWLDTVACIGNTSFGLKPVVEEHLEVLCKECHKARTKKEAKGARKPRKAKV